MAKLFEQLFTAQVKKSAVFQQYFMVIQQFVFVGLEYVRPFNFF